MKKYQKENRRYFVGALVSTLISSLFAVVLQFFKGNVLDFAVAGNILQATKSVVLLIAFILGEIGFYFCYRQFSAYFVVKCTDVLKQDIFKSVINRSYVAYRTQPQGEYIAKYTNQADTVKDRRFQMLPMFWEILFKILLVCVALFLLDWRLAIITISLLTTPLYVPKIVEKLLQKAQSACIAATEENLSKVNDWLSGYEVIKNFSIEEKILDRFRTVNRKTMDALLRDMQLSAVAQLLTTLISYLSYFIVLVCAAWLVIIGEFSSGDFFVAIGMIDQLSYPLISLAGISRQLIAVNPTCKQLEDFISAPNTTRAAGSITGFESTITFDDVSFSYDAQRMLLEHFDLTVEKGKRYLLKGPSGCGKTTAVNLLLGYFDVTGGCIRIDGNPLKSADNTYGCFTVVRQEATLFRDTLRNNLTMYQDVPQKQLMNVLTQVGLSRLANPDALDMQVNENGTNFSGGEKKRICLARALLRDTDVLILDEPLANLDAQTAEKIEDLILSIEDKTVLIVSHQFTQHKLKRFDKVIDLACLPN